MMSKKVYGTGPMNPKIMVIGEAPGRKELKENEPFVGKSGRKLNQLMNHAGIQRSDCRLTNVIKEKPKDINNFIEGGKNTSPKYDEYEESLYKEIKQTDCDVIVTVGNVPLYATTRHWGVTNRRGSIYEPERLNKMVIPTVHPSYLLRIKYVPRMYYMKYSCIHDLMRARKIAEGKLEVSSRTLHINPGFSGAMSFLDGIQDSTAFDIEVKNNEITHISFAPNKTESMCIPLLDGGKDYFNPPQELEIWQKIAEVLEDPSIRCIGQNTIFDTQFIYRKFGIETKAIDDTMVAQSIILPTFPKGLDYIASIYTTIPYWKDTSTQWGDAYQRYNALDSLACKQAMPKMYRDLKRQNNYETYQRQTNIIRPLTYIGERGIKTNLSGIIRKYEDSLDEIAEKEQELNEMAGKELNPNSPKQLINYLYEEQGYHTYKDGGSPTTNKEALKRLSRKGCDEAPLILEIRHIGKLAGTYYDPDKISRDGRLRCSFNPVGTPNGRASSSQNLFGKGMNFQNIPYEVRQYLVADEGCEFFVIDLEQAENRIVAYVAPSPRMKQVFDEGKDIHSVTGSLLSEFLTPDSQDLSPKEVKEQDRQDIKVPLGDGEHTLRHWSKTANHSLNYDMGYRSFALKNEIQEKEAKKVVNKYHSIYPNIRGSFHQWIRDKIKEDRKLDNVFGRTRKFYGILGDQLYKEAYNYIPQSTVADIINTWGLNEVYYDQELYNRVQLINMTHDSITIQMRKDDTKYQKEVLKSIRDSLESQLKWKGETFTVPIEIERGTNLCDTEVINP